MHSLFTMTKNTPDAPHLQKAPQHRAKLVFGRTGQILPARSCQLSLASQAFGITAPHQANGGARRDRTDDLLNANQALSQLSYSPSALRLCLRGQPPPGGSHPHREILFEAGWTPPRTAWRPGNQHKREAEKESIESEWSRTLPLTESRRIQGHRPTFSLRKEVIQPQVLLRLPCYDFTPIMNHTLGRYLLAVGLRTSSTIHFRDVTGGVYKARERIHGAILMRHY